MNLAVAAAREFADLDDGWPALHEALAGAAFRAQVVTWDEPQVDWDRFDLVTAMFTWGYVTRLKAFLAWAERVEAVTGLANSPRIILLFGEETPVGLTAVRWKSAEPEDPEARIALGDGIRSLGQDLRAGLTEEWRERIGTRMTALTGSGLLDGEAAVLEAGEARLAGPPRRRSEPAIAPGVPAHTGDLSPGSFSLRGPLPCARCL